MRWLAHVWKRLRRAGPTADDAVSGGGGGTAAMPQSRKALNRHIGNLGERAAEHALARRGARVLERQWRCPAGEIDLLVERRGTLRFVEVKTRSPRAELAHTPEAAVDLVKRSRIRTAARAYLARWRDPSPHAFDVVAVHLDADDRVTKIEVFEEAFGDDDL